MTEFDRDPNIEWIAREARRPVHMADGARARLVAAVRELPTPASRSRGLAWFVTSRSLAISPLAGGLIAAGLVGVGLVTGRSVLRRDDRPSIEQPAAVAATSQLPVHDTVLTVMKFVFDAPGAAHVSLVGDFNDWNTAATPMTRASSGAWTVSLKLEPGRHVYAFVLDGKRWVPDPVALLAPDDGFGTRNSIVVVAKGSST
jgi:hypothetical protein